MKRIFPLALITLGLLLSVAALGQLYLSNRTSSTDITNLPKEVAGLSLTQTQTGSAAIAEFADLQRRANSTRRCVKSLSTTAPVQRWW